MSLFGRLVKGRTTEETFTNYTVPNMGRTKSGVNVSQSSALRQAAVWACIRLRAETIGMLPLSVVEYDGETRNVVDGPAWLERPNPEMTPFDLFERTSASLDVDGNSFWWLERDNLGRIVEVWPLPPTKVRVFRNKQDEKRFQVADDKDDYGPERIFHICGFGMPGRLRGLSPIDLHASSIGLAVAADDYGESFFANGAVMSGIIESPGDPGEIAARRMQASFERDHRGLRNAHRPGFLFGGAKWTQLTIPNDAAQFLETRKYQVSEIARIFRVPPHKIGDLDHATFSNIEHQAIEWVQDGVMPYTTRIEKAVAAAGMLERGQRLKFNMAGLLRGDTKSMYEAFAIGRNWGWLSADDIRAYLDLNPLPDGAGAPYLTPLNMVAAGKADDAMSAGELAAALQKIYLAVDVVISPEEARAILNRSGAGLGPTPAALTAKGEQLALDMKTMEAIDVA